jgi:hypothetical protein
VDKGRKIRQSKRKAPPRPVEAYKTVEQIDSEMPPARFCDRQILEIFTKNCSTPRTFLRLSALFGRGWIDPVKTRLKRQNPESLVQLIVNYDGVEVCLKKYPAFRVPRLMSLQAWNETLDPGMLIARKLWKRIKDECCQCDLFYADEHCACPIGVVAHNTNSSIGLLHPAIIAVVMAIIIRPSLGKHSCFCNFYQYL